MKNSIAAIIATMLIAGCSTTPTTLEEARGIPAQHVFKRELMQRQEGFAQVTLIRDFGIVGSGVYNQLFLNGERLAAIDRGETMTLWLKPAIYTLTVNTSESWERAMPAHATIRTLEIDARPDRLYNVRIGYSGGQFIFDSTSTPKK